MGKVLIKNGNLIDGRSDELQKNVDILINQGLIESVSNDSISVDDDTKIIDAAGRTVLPGLFDCHVHLMWTGSTQPAAEVGNELDTYVAIKASEIARRFLRLGVTTVRDAGSRGTTVISLARAVRDKLTIGPRVVTCGPFICMTGGHCWDAGIEADGADETRKKARKLLRDHPDLGFLKIMATGGMYGADEDPGSPQYTLEEIRPIVEEAHKQGKKVASHAQGIIGIRNSLDAGVDSIEHGIYADDNALDRMARDGTYLVPTMIAMLAYAEGEGSLPPNLVAKGKRVVDAHFKMLQKAIEKGVTIATGTDIGGRNKPPEVYFRELDIMEEAGMSRMDVIKSSTSIAAQCCGLDNLGIIEAGYLADIIVVNGNPLEDLKNLQNLEAIIKDGEIIKR
ncbi:amidohydrolase family protein [Candidatus Saccharibacteria bacterium]|nr:amidohydrolase family protein [Candidatus Saccharibacteria bacterium]